METINKAIEKLTKEMMKLNNPFAQAIEEHLTEICTSDVVAEKILNDGKSLKGACDSIRDAAKKNAVGGVGAVSDEDAYRMAEEYYGINKINRAEKHETMNVLDLL